MSDNDEDKGGELACVPKGISLTPALTNFFKPTLDLLGVELRDYVKERIESWKERKRRENLESHVTAVNEELAGDNPFDESGPTVYQLSLFEEWAENVRDIDPNDHELSAMWRNLLIRAAKGEHISEEVRRALQSLSPQEALFIVQLERRVPVFPLHSGLVNDKDRYLANQLLGKGLVEKDYAYPVFFLVSFILAGMVALTILGDTWDGVGMKFIAAGTAIVVAMLGFTMRSGLARWRLSWLGRELVRLVSKQRKRL